MPSKVTKNKAKEKVALRPDFTRQFIKDWRDLQRSGSCNMDRLKDLIDLLVANTGPLPPANREHTLAGPPWAGYLECHMGGDVLLIYSRSDTEIRFARAGSHAKLFE